MKILKITGCKTCPFLCYNPSNGELSCDEGTKPDLVVGIDGCINDDFIHDLCPMPDQETFKDWHLKHKVADVFGYENVPSLKLMEFIFDESRK